MRFAGTGTRRHKYRVPRLETMGGKKTLKIFSNGLVVVGKKSRELGGPSLSCRNGDIMGGPWGDQSYRKTNGG